MVYDASKSQLNACLWAPNFALPMVDTLVSGIDEHSWLGDIDIGEMFFNFMLHPELQPYAGVDLRPYWQEECPRNQTLWERWVRCLMGLKPSPYKCIKALLLAIEVVKGDRRDPCNPFQWDQIQLNLPGTTQYDPSKPRLSRLQVDGSTLASLLVSFVNDMRTAVSSEEVCWGAMHAVSYKLAHLGIQVATRKTRPPATNPGPWSGSMITTDDIGIGVRATQEQWDNPELFLKTLCNSLTQASPLIERS